MSAPLITGLGIVSPVGVGKTAFGESLRAGKSGLRDLRGLDVSAFRIGRGGEVDADIFDPADGLPRDQRCLAFTLHACRQALADAGLDAAALPPETALAVGSGAGEMRAMEASLGPPEAELPLEAGDPIQPPNAVTGKLARRLGLHGRQLTFINACAAGAQAIAVAADLVKRGRAELALAGGVEILNRMVLSGFEALRAVSPTGCRPFDAERDGIQLAELAAFVVLERAERARARGARAYGRVSGSGASADAFHVVQPDGEGTGAALAIDRALADAGLSPDDIDYVNAHGTGTVHNDSAELAALARVFGERAARMPISSTKSMLGHALGASGAAEVVIGALALSEQFIPPTATLRLPMEGYEGFDFVPGAAREGVDVRHLVSNAFAFGGNNVVLVLSAAEEAGRPEVVRA